MHSAPDVVIQSEAQVGEGPVFDARTGRLVWVDITSGTLFQNDLISGNQLSNSFSTNLGAAAPRSSKDGFAVAISEGFGFVASGVLEITDPVLPESFRRMNDAKVDSRGRMWAGSTHLEFVAGVGALHSWDGLGPSVIHSKGFSLPNGLGWNIDDSRMYLVDSVQHTLLVAEFHADEGEVGTFQPIATIDPGMPDGLAIDQDGCVWLAIWGGGQVQRFTPVGELIEIIPLPVPQPSSCAFGADGTLYITSARAGLSREELEAAPLSGSVFAVSTRSHGVPVFAFGN